MCYKIIGKNILTNHEMLNFVLENNPNLDKKYYDLVNIYLHISKHYHIKGDLAYFQMIAKTDFLTDEEMISKNNFYGAKVNGQLISFNSIGEGVLAHIQHIYAYVSDSVILINEKVNKYPIIDPLFYNVKEHNIIAWKQFKNTDFMSIRDYKNSPDRLYDKCVDYCYDNLTKEQYLALLNTISNNNEQLRDLNNSVEKLISINTSLDSQLQVEMNRNTELVNILQENKEFILDLNVYLKQLTNTDVLDKLIKENKIEEINFDKITQELSDRMSVLTKEFETIKKENKKFKEDTRKVLDRMCQTLDKIDEKLLKSKELETNN